MKKLTLYVAAILLFCGCANGQTSSDFATVPQAKPGESIATFGGGCFWSMSEAMSELKGVDKVVSGYAGGTTKNPTYEDVGTQTTGHAEVVQIYYDPKVISYETLVKSFFFAHDPTELNRQGPDEGTDYRSIAFYRNDEEKKIIEAEIKRLTDAKTYSSKIVTEVKPLTKFYSAEAYHQEYILHHPDNPYVRNVSIPDYRRFRDEFKEGKFKS